ncbi:purine permease [Nocardia terpenica]|uniref:nucleobase:cation symporter-2 family protein n=1 Tax=Nocardia terpenica TaxID=455432 RepID=UPI001892DABB|nr:nucleobase:cation symporter-2 family protein [Nocardia terpenica]MBF6064807.1 purine permease [Nocardia terpenica]MBF6107322.1 purine permease [Nocardia terpenica]MBF6115079.1 purine permease [Nocardia terpenica]MBF6122185.1 purine permease [Nocardia terpenica]MBF6154568.1 purine permease [Nocardia terpenica]
MGVRRRTRVSTGLGGETEEPHHHPVDALPPPWQLLAGGLQHIAAMVAGVVAPPLIIGAAVGLGAVEQGLLITASLFSAGLATLLQSLGWWRFGARLPLINGASFAAVAPILAIVGSSAHGDALPIVYGATLVAGVLATLAAPYFSRLQRFFPPVVGGTVITLIGLSLLPVTLNWVRGTGEGGGGGTRVPTANLAIAAVTLVVVLICHRFLRGFWRQLALLIGLVAGTLLAWPLGLIDTSTLRGAAVFGFVPPLHFGAPQFHAGAIISLCIVMLVVMTESTATMMALGEIVDRPADERTLADGLRAAGAGTALSAVLGGFPCGAFAQNVGLVALTRMHSRYVVATSGALLVLLGLFPVASGIVELVPKPALGGAGLVLFGTVAASGIRTLGRADLSDPVNTIIVGVSLFIGMTPIVAPSFYTGLPAPVVTIMGSGISAGCITAILLHQAFRIRARRAVGAEA